MNALISLALIFFLVEMTSHYLNPNLVRNLCDAVVLQSMIILTANSLRIKILLAFLFLVGLLVCICVLYGIKNILL